MAFRRAARDAGISVRIGSDGGRFVGENATMDRNHSSGSNQNNNRNNGGRWQRGGRYNRGRGYNRGRNSRGGNSYHPRSRIEDDDDDVSMNDNINKPRHSPYGGGPRNHNSRNDYDSSSSWWKVTIPDGRKHNREWLLKQLERIGRMPVDPIQYHLFKDTVIFYLNEKSVADAVAGVNNRLTVRDGTKLFISVKPSKPPGGTGSNDSTKSGGPSDFELTPEKLEVLKKFLGSRYDPSAVKLDLTNIYFDQILRSGSIEGKIYNLMETILKLINEICPQLKILDLSDNRIAGLKLLQDLSKLCPNLEELDLSKNNIRFTGELSKLKENKTLKKLFLNNNPVKEQFQKDGSDDTYKIEVRKHLPNLDELDGVALPPAIKVGLENEFTLPPSKDGYSANENVLKIVALFIQNFVKVYDAEDVNDRQQLLPAYHNDASFSLSMNTAVFTNEKQASLINDYSKVSRNLTRTKDQKIRSQCIKHKKLSVVAALTELPKTKHLTESFLLDIPMVTASMICFNLHGIFYEGEKNCARGFTRSFIAVPDTSSEFLILNDQLHIRNVTEKQLKTLNNPTTKVNSQGTNEYLSSCTPEQIEMVQNFSIQSKMNAKGSFEALKSNQWNFEEAARKFTELKNNGKIPPEFFH